MGQKGDWRLRICALATALGIYLVISALLSTQSVSFPSGHFELSGGRRAGHSVGRGPTGPVVALASFPGSGNTWVRYLLQQATGILTGSVYKDYALLKNGFPAESIINGSVLLVKTHEFGEEARRPFHRVIILVRDPFSSLLAEFNRRSGGHIGYASADKYRRNGGRHWKNFVYNMANDWERMNLDWYYGFPPKRRLVVFYDQLKENPERELRRLLDFLRVSVTNSTIQCVMEKKEGIYKRTKRLLNFSPFDDAMRTTLLQKQKIVYDVMQRTDDESLNGVEVDVTTTDVASTNVTKATPDVMTASKPSSVDQINENDFQLENVSSSSGQNKTES